MTLWLGNALILLGCFFLLVGGLGMLRLPDFFARIHAGGMIDTLGAGFFLAGLMFHGGWTLASVKLGLILLLLLLATPTAAHALAGAAHVMGIQPAGLRAQDDNEDTAPDAPAD